MKFVAIADTHGKHRLLKTLPEADVLIHAGDISLIDDTHLAEDSGHQVEFH
ncbi:metallophosphoesterase family protein [Flavisolibacter ginsenosidimutans]|uniref:hypothetical protein n=1 Tax=Flavisolibacter ginsenosidimutans TaxID=661481 RepID=UPI001D13D2BC|nr:hypothetical protein [Flavisolibacter ginsenosidimutans]